MSIGTLMEQAPNGQHDPGHDLPGSEPASEPHIRFGPRPNQIVPASWAEDMLTRLSGKHPAIFRDLLYHAATGDELAESGGRRRG